MRGRLVPMIGKVFTELTVLEYSHSDISHRYYKCVCSCGQFRVVSGDKLRDGRTRRCVDCARAFRYQNSSPQYKASTRDRTKDVWRAIIQRCTNPNNKDYANYAGRNIKIEDSRWYLYNNFRDDMGEAPLGLQIDRIDNDRGYCKENCRWTTPKINTNNRRVTQKSKKARDMSFGNGVMI